MHDVFVSHAKDDWQLATEIASALEALGFSTWRYQRDTVAGVDYLTQLTNAIAASRSMLVLITPASVDSRQVTAEITHAFEEGIPLIPILAGITHEDFQKRRADWRHALGASTSVEVPTGGVAAIAPRIVGGLSQLGIVPSIPPIIGTGPDEPVQPPPGPVEPPPISDPPMNPERKRFTRSLALRITEVIAGVCVAVWGISALSGNDWHPLKSTPAPHARSLVSSAAGKRTTHPVALDKPVGPAKTRLAKLPPPPVPPKPAVQHRTEYQTVKFKSVTVSDWHVARGQTKVVRRGRDGRYELQMTRPAAGGPWRVASRKTISTPVSEKVNHGTGIECPNHHLNPPGSRHCWKCRAAM